MISALITGILSNAMSGAGGAAFASVVSVWRRRKARERDINETVNRAVQSLIGDLRQDCADARRDAKEAKTAAAECETKHARCETELASMRAEISKWKPSDITPPHEFKGRRGR